LVVALTVLLCTIEVQGRDKRQAQASGPCNIDRPSTPAKLGEYVPQCTSLGLFEIVQSHPSTGYKWCVNPMTGEKVEGTDVAPGFLGGLFSRPKCGKCLYALAKYQSTVALYGIGGHAPQCDAKGLYSVTQSSGGTGYSWCVNPENGDVIKGSEVAPGAGQAKCDAARQKREETPQAFGPCNIDRPSTPAKLGQYVPQCTEWGLFEIIQKHPSTGYKWCVNPLTGVKVEGSDVAPSIFSKPKCGKCLYDLNKATLNTAIYGIGGATPQCDAKGLYNAKQSGGGTGYTWCVKPETGDVIKGSEVAPGVGQANCEAGHN